jgi:hypothetical protein
MNILSKILGDPSDAKVKHIDFKTQEPVPVVRNPRLTYRGNGDIHFDPYSRKPSHVDYNYAREAIRQAKKRGEKSILIRLSTAMSEELEKDGYKINHKNGNDNYSTVSWK